MIASTSRPASTAATISAWPGRKSGKPKTWPSRRARLGHGAGGQRRVSGRSRSSSRHSGGRSRRVKPGGGALATPSSQTTSAPGAIQPPASAAAMPARQGRDRRAGRGRRGRRGRRGGGRGGWRRGRGPGPHRSTPSAARLRRSSARAARPCRRRSRWRRRGTAPRGRGRRCRRRGRARGGLGRRRVGVAAVGEQVEQALAHPVRGRAKRAAGSPAPRSARVMPPNRPPTIRISRATPTCAIRPLASGCLCSRRSTRLRPLAAAMGERWGRRAARGRSPGAVERGERGTRCRGCRRRRPGTRLPPTWATRSERPSEGCRCRFRRRPGLRRGSRFLAVPGAGGGEPEATVVAGDVARDLEDAPVRLRRGG